MRVARPSSPHPSGPLLPSPLLSLIVPLVLTQGYPDETRVPMDLPYCPHGEIRDIEIQAHSVFTTDDLPEQSRLRWVYDLSNAVRIRTREDFVRDKLLFREGDCFDEGLAQESARILREFRFIGRAEVLPVRREEGTVDLRVETRDEWSTKVSLALRFEDGVHFEGASVVEENFLGRGATVSLYRVTREAEQSTGAMTEIPGLRGSGWDLIAGGHRGRIGSGFQQVLIHPFQGEVGRHAFRQRVSRTRSLFPYSYQWRPEAEETEFSHLVVPLITERAEVSGARRWGDPGDLWLLGGGISYERASPGSVEQVEGVRSGSFGDRAPASPEEAELLAPQLVTRRAIRANVITGARRISYERREGLDALAGVQDLPVGRELLLSAGRSLGSTGPDRPADVFAALTLRLGWGGETTAAYLTGMLEGRREDVSGSVVGKWGDLLTESHAFLYWQPDRPWSRTLLLRATVQGGWDTTSPFQLHLGGADGVRGYREWDLPVARKVVFTVENRGRFPGPFSGLVDLGFTLFGDVGAGWEGDVPLAVDTGWRGTVGGGLRVGFPAGSSRVIRADLAVPIGPNASDRGPVFRISAREWIGILDDFRNPDAERSRRSGIRPDYVGAARDRAIP
jgi:hypothetical protein